uniref:Uncharacterized protein n=1 Tax=Denticeps clupeoides TaxID=299321 RepID=A0AAY4AWL7_9TELE
QCVLIELYIIPNLSHMCSVAFQMFCRVSEEHLTLTTVSSPPWMAEIFHITEGGQRVNDPINNFLAKVGTARIHTYIIYLCTCISKQMHFLNA